METRRLLLQLKHRAAQSSLFRNGNSLETFEDSVSPDLNLPYLGMETYSSTQERGSVS